MTFSYVPADQPVIYMQFTPAGKDNCVTEGMVHTDMASETPDVEAEEKRAAKEVSTEAEKTSKKTAGPHISSVDQESQLRASQLTKCEYHRDCISVGKRQADQRPGDSFDSLILTATTGRSRVAVVVGMRMNADQIGSPVDCLAVPSSTNNLPKESCWVGGRAWNERLRCLKMDRTVCPQAAADKAYTARTVCHEVRLKSPIDAPVSRPGCWHKIDEEAAVSRFRRHGVHGEKRNAAWPKNRSVFRFSIHSHKCS